MPIATRYPPSWAAWNFSHHSVDAVSNLLLPFGRGGIFTHHVKNGLAMSFGLTGMRIKEFKVVPG